MPSSCSIPSLAPPSSTAHHPQTQGKVERFQQTLNKWLRAQPDQPTTITELQLLLDEFAEEYNQRRPHRSLEHRATPATAYTTSIKATPQHQPARRYPQPGPPRSHRQIWHRQPSRRWTTSSHRRRPNPRRNPRRNPRHLTHPRTRRHRHQRHNRRDPAGAHYRPQPRLPTRRHKKIVRTHKPWVRTIPMSCDITLSG
nr:integrase core domain-containing protein [Arthrobacter roseus]